MPDVCEFATESPFRMSQAVRVGLPHLVDLVAGRPSLKREIAEAPLLEPVRQGSGYGLKFEFASASHRQRGLGFRLRQIQSTPACTGSLPFVSIKVRNPNFSSACTRWLPARNNGSPPLARKDHSLCRPSIRMRSRRRGSLVPASFVPSTPISPQRIDADPAGVRTSDRSRRAYKSEKSRARTSLWARSLRVPCRRWSVHYKIR